jgi:hypothetical protein
MTEMTALNGQLTDAVTQANVKILGDTPAQGMATLYQPAAQSLALSMQNTISGQQQANIINSAATIQGVNSILTLNSAITNVATTTLNNQIKIIPTTEVEEETTPVNRVRLL